MAANQRSPRKQRCIGMFLWGVVFLVIQALGLVVTPRTACATDPDTIEMLGARGEMQHAAIKTASIRFRIVRTGNSYVIPATYADVQKNLSEANLAGDKEGLKTLCDRLLTNPAQYAVPWCQAELIVDGEKYRETLFIRNDHVAIDVYDGTTEIKASEGKGFRHAYLYGRMTSQPSILFSELVSIPRIQFDPWTIVLQSDDSLLLRRTYKAGHEIDIAIDIRTGFLNSMRFKNAEGSVTHERQQFSPTLYPGDIVCPRAVVETSYNHGKLAQLKISVLDDVRLNQNLPADTFVVGMMGPARIVDHRFRAIGKSPREFSSRNAISDVVEFANSAE